MPNEVKAIVYGIGNPGRRDDGLGPKLISRLQDEGMADVDFEIRYQLNVEEAWRLKDQRLVIFVDAATDIEAPLTLSEIQPADSIAFTTHEMAPESLLALCLELFGRAPKAFVLAIRGYRWEMGEDLSEEAQKNLERAAVALKDFLKSIA